MGTSDHMPFVLGLLLGFAAGLAVGVMWRCAFKMIGDAMDKRGDKTAPRDDKPVWGVLDKARHADFLTKMGWLLGFVSIMLLALGVFQVIGYTRLSSFISCQADYNQQSAKARQVRVGAQDTETAALYKVLQSFNKVLETNPTNEQMQLKRQDLTRAIDKALASHELRIKATRQNPYPEEPEKSCGDY